MPRDKDTVLDVESGKVEPTGLPASDVLYYELEGGAWVCVRPSGTEPKIKFYYGVKASSMDEAQVESAKFAEWAKAQAQDIGPTVGFEYMIKNK